MKTSRWMPLMLAAVLGLSPAVQALGAAPEPSAEETLYVTMDAYGKTTYQSVVKNYTLNGAEAVTDYGQYQSIQNMTNYVQPQQEEDAIRFDLTEEPLENGRFYFEGQLADDAVVLPWQVDVSYRMNGVDLPAEDLAGQQGMAEITLHLAPQMQTNSYYRDNMMLLAATMLDLDDYLSVQAEGAQVQTVGNQKIVAFLALPGEEQTFTLRLGSGEFHFPGFFFLMVPMTTAQVEDLETLREKKETVEDSFDVVGDSLDVILDTLSAMKGSVQTTQDAISALEEARSILSEAKEQTFAAGDAALEGMGEATAAADSLPEHLAEAQTALNQTHQALLSFNDAFQGLREPTEELRQQMTDTADTIDKLTSLIDTIKDQRKTRKDLFHQAQEDLEDLQDQQDALTEALNEMSSMSGRLPSGAGLTEIPTTGDAQTDIMIAMVNRKIQEVNGLLSALGRVGNAAEGDLGYAASVLNQILFYGYRLADDLSEAITLLDDYITPLEEQTEELSDLADEAQHILTSLSDAARTLTEVVEETDHLVAALDQYEGEGEEAIADGRVLAEETITAMQETRSYLSSLQETAKAASGPLDDGTKNLFSGLSEALGQTANGLEQTDTIQNAKDTVWDLARSEWDQWTGEKSTLLNVDAEATPASFTSEKNHPSSVQVVARTAEIKTEETEQETNVDETYRAEGNVLTRLKNVFVRIWQWIKGIFTA